MKLKYIITAFVSALVFAGCQTEPMVGSFADFSVDKTFISIPMNGGSVDVNLTTDGTWQFSKHYDTGKKDDAGKKVYDYAPSWITLSSLSGSGDSRITITASATESGREVELQLKNEDGSRRQHLVVRQGTVEAVAATCKEVLEGPDGKNFKVTGKVVSIANTTYGNWYLKDDSTTETVYVYGTLDKDGKEKNFTSLGIEVGDIVTVSGPKTTYNGTVELVNVTVLNIDKALLTIFTEEPVLDQPEGSFDVKVAYKGRGAYVSMSSETAAWVSLKSSKYIAGIATIFEKSPADTVLFTFDYTANEGDKLRKGVLTFTSSMLDEEDKETVLSTVMDFNIAQKSASKKGTVAEPYTVAEITELLLGGETLVDDVYIKGKVSAVKDTYSAKYGNGTFWISDDGKAYGVSEDKKKTTEPTKDFECYQVLWFGNQSWVDGNAQIEVGDEVIICGKTTVYNGMAETSGKKAWVYSVNGALTDANGIGNVGYPFNVAGAEAFIDAMEAAKAAAKEAGAPTPTFPDVCVKGKVSAVKDTFSAKYGNGTFWISDDGTAYGVSSDKKTTTEPTKDFECYQVLWLGNKAWVEGDGQVAVGDDVIIKGQLTKYNGIYETSGKKAYVYSLNGETAK